MPISSIPAAAAPAAHGGAPLDGVFGLMEYLVRHRTTYRYLQDVSYSCHEAHLGLRETPQQQVISSQLTLDPPPASRSKRKDYFGNPCEWFTLDQPHAHLEVLA